MNTTSFCNMKVAVTGGAGPIGSYLADELAASGAHVIVIDDFSKGLCSNLSACTGPGDCRACSAGCTKGHFMLAAERDKLRVAAELQVLIESYRTEYVLESCETYLQRWAKAGRYGDPAEVIFVKRMLQKGLPDPARTLIADILFERIENIDQRAFADEIYLTTMQLRETREAGLYVGGHGYNHLWLDTLPAVDQQQEVAGMLDFLRKLGIAGEPWMLTYPYGAHGDRLIDALSKKGCLVGFNVVIGIADLASDRFMALPRLDANHLPMEGCAANDWTLRAID